ncbi:unnamed protein product [Medioppia subpectinata]|uniref:NR LBD domain-containing protein n=1 Tax=Medioppia subpectinata TaxID=1979941 RepID=A0A7R9KH50_9ACAR|nr:unnamed protein product [Medioppia subpectinata]CAG2103176.1 unnamed protein product [Medioppia subpectinata]
MCDNFGKIVCKSCEVFKRKTTLKYKLIKCCSGPNAFSFIREMFETGETDYKTYTQRVNKAECIIATTSLRDQLMDIRVNLSLKPVFNEMIDFNFFTELQMRRVAELFNSTNVFDHEPSHPMAIIEITDLVQLNRLCVMSMAQDVRDVLAFANNLHSFNNLCPGDQLSLLKYACYEIAILRATLLFDINTEYFTMICDHYTENPTIGLYKLDVMKEEKHHLYSYYKSYLHKTLPEWNRDPVIFNLLTAIVLFNPNRPNISHRDVIQAEQKLYIYLLQCYLYMKCRSEAETQSKLSKLMNPLTDLQVICEIEKKIGHEIYYYESVGPNLKDFFMQY